MQFKTKLLTILSLVAILAGCAAPATKTIELSSGEVRREEQAQRDMVRKYPHKKQPARKHKELSYYQNKLRSVAGGLSRAAKQLCNKGECSYEFKVADQNVLNAWADGKSVNITPIMIDFLDSDKELVVVLAHELAHNVMSHIGKQKQNTVIGMIVDLAAAAGGVDTRGVFGSIGSSSHSQGFENEADYIGIYIMANAGYDITNVNYLWRKMSVQSPDSISGSFFSSHPSNAERFLRMQKTINEVNAKKRAGQKLVPNFHHD